MQIRLGAMRLMLILCGITCSGVWASRTDRAAQQNAQTRAEVKERYFEVQRELRKFLMSETEKRVLWDQKQKRTGPVQSSTVRSLPLIMRVDPALLERGLVELFLYVDGIYWGNFQTHAWSQREENLYWYFTNVYGVPIGERQLKITTRAIPSMVASFLGTSAGQEEFLEGSQSVFIGEDTRDLTLSLELKKNFLKDTKWIGIQVLGDSR